MTLLAIGLESFILPFFLILISLFIAHFVKFKNWFGESFHSKHILWAILALVGLLATGIGTDVVATYFGVNDTGHVEETIDVIASNPLEGIVFLITSAIGEELFFRGILQTLLGVVSIPIFALFHAGYHSMVQLLGAFLGGIVLFLSRHKTQSIYPGLIAHFLYNLLAVFFIHF